MIFKDYVIEQFELELSDPLPDEPGYKSDASDDEELMEDEPPLEENPNDEGHKNRLLRRRFDPDDFEIIDGISQLLVQERGNVTVFRQKALKQFHVIFAKQLREELVKPIFDYLEMYDDIHLIVMAFNAVCKYHPRLKKSVPLDALNLIKREYEAMKQRQLKQKAGKPQTTAPRLKKKRRGLSRMPTIPEDSEMHTQETPEADAWLIAYQHETCAQSQQEAQEPPQKRARVSEQDLMCSESM